jgi:hypothetical protein
MTARYILDVGFSILSTTSPDKSGQIVTQNDMQWHAEFEKISPRWRLTTVSRICVQLVQADPRTERKPGPGRAAPAFQRVVGCSTPDYASPKCSPRAGLSGDGHATVSELLGTDVAYGQALSALRTRRADC